MGAARVPAPDLPGTSQTQVACVPATHVLHHLPWLFFLNRVEMRTGKRQAAISFSLRGLNA